MSYIIADYLMNTKLFSGDRHNNPMIAEDNSGRAARLVVHHEQHTGGYG